MASVIVNTPLAVPAGREQELVELLGRAVTTSLDLPPEKKSIYVYPIDPKLTNGPALVTFFVYTAPDKTTEQKRVLVRALEDATRSFFGEESGVHTVVIIKIHTDENVGVSGTLRVDGTVVPGASSPAGNDQAAAAAGQGA